MEYLLFPGCKVLASDPYFEHSTKLVLEKLGVSLIEEKNFCCCGPTLVSSIDQKSGIALNARNIVLGEEKETNLFTLCSWCFKTLDEANTKLKENNQLKDSVNLILKELGKEYNGTIEIKNFLQVLLEGIGLEKIEKHLKKPLDNLKVGAFMGCHLRGGPKDIFDVNFISELDKLVNITKAQNIGFKEKFHCCGGLVSSLTEVETQLNYKIIQRLKELNLDALVVMCPYCYERFNVALNSIKQNESEIIPLSIIYLSDLFGLAMGLNPRELALDQRANISENIMRKIDE